ncbi:zinc finger matrin-type protein 1 [Oryzias latipes]|uniref:Lysine-rich coiled-coil protein 1 n=2 Tax=Oryzias latipes TaxID=8090 RepID=H2LX11_ORYLA|nr:zinc finger matrin-type protein 1 [Oryzias latipes]
MDSSFECTPALSDTSNNTVSSPNAASVTDTDRVINTKHDSVHVEGEKSDEQLLQGLLTDTYCHVCSSKLLFESHRLSHYEGKKHAQKVKVYLKTLRGEKNAEVKRTLQTNKNRFCELCNMVFSSDVVAKSHYEGKTHAKTLRKHTLHPPDQKSEELPSPNPAGKIEQKAASDVGTELHLDPTAATGSTNSSLKDPDRYCSLCAASFNNPQMALQHYNGRKHQRNVARQELLKELGGDGQQANSLMCQICGVPFDSVEMYQAHMQGNRHLTREKKISELFKSQPKVYNTFADELADYIQVQKARGITPKTSQGLAQGDAAKGDQEEEAQEESENWEMAGTIPNPPHPPQSGTWHPVYPGSSCTLHNSGYNGPPPLLQCSDPSQFIIGPTESGQYRRHLSSPSCSMSSSSSSSSYSSHTSDSDGGEHELKDRRTSTSTRKNGYMKRKNEGSDKEGRRLKRQRRGGERRRRKRRRKEQAVESEDEGRRKKQRISSDKKPKDKKQQSSVMEEEKDPHLQTTEHDKQAKLKYGKEKKKTKDKPDRRTEEEKLWDDSILGC